MHILIADDDIKTAEKMKTLAEKNIKGIRLKIVEATVKSVLDGVQEHSPAVIILGVNLNGLNGLEVTKYLRSIEIKSEVIIVSSYDYFDFAREAIQLGVFDYLLKPVSETQFVKTLKGALERYQIRVNKEDRTMQQERSMEEARRHLEYCLIYSALFNGEASEEIKNYKKMFQLGDVGYILNIELDTTESSSAINLKRDDVRINEYLRRIISEHNTCVIGPRSLDRVLVWVDTSETGRKRPESPMADIKLAAHIIIGLKERFLLSVSIGIGGEKNIFNLHSSYEEAVRCLRYKGTHNVMRIRDVETREISPVEYNELENRLLKSIKFGKAEIVNLFVELLDQLKGLEEKAERSKIYELLVLTYHEARLAGINDLEYLDFKEYFQETWDLPIELVERWAYLQFENIINSVQTSRLKIKSDVVNSAIRYMEEHYMDEITLEEIARYVGVSPQHFSKTFKDENGINYIDWLTNLRIDIAKRLLAEGKSTIKEICYMVGYNDPNYFSRIFRKIIGTSPTEFARGQERT